MNRQAWARARIFLSSCASSVRRAGRYAADLVFPKRCISCGREGTYWCEDCLALIPINRVEERRALPRGLATLFYAASYEDALVRKAIRLYKYPPLFKELSAPLAWCIIAHLSLLDKPPKFLFRQDKQSGGRGHFVLVPIPLHPKRLRWRGFNQAEELANHLAEFLRIPLRNDLLIRTIHTIPQARLAPEQRKENAANIFTAPLPDQVTNKTIILVDDVYTTGSTMGDAARALKRAGAAQVLGITVARG